jgi:hypothetical protein
MINNNKTVIPLEYSPDNLLTNEIKEFYSSNFLREQVVARAIYIVAGPPLALTGVAYNLASVAAQMTKGTFRIALNIIPGTKGTLTSEEIKKISLTITTLVKSLLNILLMPIVGGLISPSAHRWVHIKLELGVKSDSVTIRNLQVHVLPTPSNPSGQLLLPLGGNGNNNGSSNSNAGSTIPTPPPKRPIITPKKGDIPTPPPFPNASVAPPAGIPLPPPLPGSGPQKIRLTPEQLRQQKVNNLNRTINTLTEELRQLEEQIVATKAAMRGNQARRTANDQELSRLQVTLKNHLKEIEAKQRSLAAKELELEETRKMCQKIIQSIARYQSNIANGVFELFINNTPINADRETLLKALDTLTNSKVENEQQQAELSREINAIKADTDRVLAIAINGTTVGQFVTQLKEQQRLHVEITDMTNSLTAQRTDLEKQKKQKTSAIEHIEDQLAALNGTPILLRAVQAAAPSNGDLAQAVAARRNQQQLENIRNGRQIDVSILFFKE